ncbi:hypothetical protein ACLI4Z_03580 [Natrialbaceae archaeon A-arb3/5]
MTRTIRTLRTTAGSMLTEIGAAVGTFVGVAWLAANVAALGTHGSRAASAEPAVPDAVVWLCVLGVASLGTVWLERDGYRRLSADPTGGSDFAWLSVFYLPITFFPTGYALAQLGGSSEAVASAYLIACTALGGWLAFYGGLDRLGVRTQHFARACFVVFATVLVVAMVNILFSASGVLDGSIGALISNAWVLATLALLGQGAALLAGFGRAVRESIT